MITIFVIVSVLLFFLIGVLFLPLIIVVNTNKGAYNMRLPGIFRIDLIFNNDLIPSLNLKLFFFKINIKSDRNNNKTKKTNKLKKKRNLNKPNKLMKSMLNQFEINRLNADIDTGDFPLNAQIIPITYGIRHPNINVRINFQDINYVDLKISTRPVKLLTAYLKHKLKYKK